MRINSLEALVQKVVWGAAVLLLGVCAAEAQTNVSLTAAPTSLTLPDGNSVPMWGYFCRAASGGTCSALNANAGISWSPVIITVPYSSTGTTLNVTLTNSLSFSNGNNIPTSLMIVGQLGAGLEREPRTCPVLSTQINP